MLGILRLAVRHLRASAPRTVFIVVAVGLGVGLMVAVMLANRSITVAFEGMIDALAGDAGLEVSGGDAGFSEEILETVRSVPGVRSVAPLVLGSVFLDDDSGDLLSIVGVDVTAESDVRTYRALDGDGQEVDALTFLNSRESVLVTEAWRSEHGATAGQSIEVLTPVGTRRLTIRGFLRPEGVARLLGSQMAIMDLFAAQALFDKGHRVDRASLVLAPGSDRGVVERAVRAVIPRGLEVATPESRGGMAETALAGFRGTVAGMSVLALLVGGCLVYNSLATVVIERQRDFAVLRALGGRRGDVERVVLAEALLIGTIGSALGLVIGQGLVRLMLEAIARSAETQSLVLMGRPSVIAPGVAEVLTACAGILAAGLAGWAPARSTRSVSITANLRQGGESGVSAPVTGIGRLAAVLVAAGIAGTAIGLWRGAPVAIGLGTAFLVPGLLVASAALATALLRRLGKGSGIGGGMIAGSVARQPRRVLLTAGMVATGAAFFVFVVVVYDSIAETFVDEVRRTFKADLMVSPVVLAGGRLTAPVDGRVAADIAEVDGVTAVVAVRRVSQRFRGAPITVASYSDAYFTDATLNGEAFVAGDPVRACRAVAAGTGALVSENFAFNFGVGVGDTLEVDGPRGSAMFETAGVVVDNFDQNGTIVLSQSAYRSEWNDPMASWFHVYVAPSAGVADVMREIRRSTGRNFRLVLRTRDELLTHVVDSVRDAFRFATGLEVVVACIVVFSLVETLLVSVVARRHEIGILRALGARRRDVVRFVTLEGLAIGVVGTASGMLAGVALGALWMRAHLRYFFGWMMDVHVPVEALLMTLISSAVVAAAASLYPGYRAARLPIRESLASE